MESDRLKGKNLSDPRFSVPNTHLHHPLLDQVNQLAEAHRLRQYSIEKPIENKGFLSENLDLKGWKATSLDLKENALFIELRNRKKEKSRIIFMGVIALRDEGVIGKSLSGLTLSDQGSFKRLFLRGSTKDILFFVDCMEARLENAVRGGE